MLEAAATAAAAASVDAARYVARSEGLDRLDLPVGDRVVQTALAIWAERIEEPSANDERGREHIDSFIRGATGLGWSWEPQYIRNGQFAWCGAFAAECYGRNGLNASIRRKSLPSCYRLKRDLANLRIALSSIQPGDIVVVGGEGGKSWGDHITIAVEVHGGLIYTVEGNARGLLPDGSEGEGVIKRTRPLPKTAGGPGISNAECPVSGRPQSMEVMHVYRPRPADFI